jgi:kynurenine formamidase
MSYGTFDELPELGSTGERIAWDAFGRHDELGTINFITPAVVLAAVKLVREGVVVNLNLPIGENWSPWGSGRQATRSEFRTDNGRDDRLDNFYLQGTTQWDSLRHVRFKGLECYYGGRTDKELDAGELGIHVWAARGIISRGVLLDVEGYFAGQGGNLSPNDRFQISGDLLDDIASAQGVEIRPGDVVLLRTGWLKWYQSLAEDTREDVQAQFKANRRFLRMPGIDPSRETVGWFWNHRIAGVAIDTPAFEALEYRREDGWAHQRLIPLLGMAIGELWALDDLGQKCLQTGSFEFLLMSAPLNVPQGVGTTANAYAIF